MELLLYSGDGLDGRNGYGIKETTTLDDSLTALVCAECARCASINTDRHTVRFKRIMESRYLLASLFRSSRPRVHNEIYNYVLSEDEAGKLLELDWERTEKLLLSLRTADLYTQIDGFERYLSTEFARKECGDVSEPLLCGALFCACPEKEGKVVMSTARPFHQLNALFDCLPAKLRLDISFCANAVTSSEIGGCTLVLKDPASSADLRSGEVANYCVYQETQRCSIASNVQRQADLAVDLVKGYQNSEHFIREICLRRKDMSWTQYMSLYQMDWYSPEAILGDLAGSFGEEMASDYLVRLKLRRDALEKLRRKDLQKQYPGLYSTVCGLIEQEKHAAQHKALRAASCEEPYAREDEDADEAAEKPKRSRVREKQTDAFGKSKSKAKHSLFRVFCWFAVGGLLIGAVRLLMSLLCVESTSVIRIMVSAKAQAVISRSVLACVLCSIATALAAWMIATKKKK